MHTAKDIIFLIICKSPLCIFILFLKFRMHQLYKDCIIRMTIFCEVFSQRSFYFSKVYFAVRQKFYQTSALLYISRISSCICMISMLVNHIKSHVFLSFRHLKNCFCYIFTFCRCPNTAKRSLCGIHCHIFGRGTF